MDRLGQLGFVDLVCEGRDIILEKSEVTLREKIEGKCSVRRLCKTSYPRVSLGTGSGVRNKPDTDVLSSLVTSGVTTMPNVKSSEPQAGPISWQHVARNL